MFASHQAMPALRSSDLNFASCAATNFLARSVVAGSAIATDPPRTLRIRTVRMNRINGTLAIGVILARNGRREGDIIQTACGFAGGRYKDLFEYPPANREPHENPRVSSQR